MRALTLTQPWAGLVASGIKLVENRPRRMIKREDFSKRFAIHASREIDEETYATIRRIAPDLAIDRPDADTFQWRDHGWVGLSRVTSSVIAVATIDHVVVGDAADLNFEDENSRRIRALPPEQRRWFFGPVGYVLRDVVTLPTPVPCRGWQGFWTLPEDVRAKVEEQLR